MDSLTPSDLFSPSKARAQRALTQDWAQIDSWLSYKYSGRTIPSFERNAETLQALRDLSSSNERADEQALLTSRLESEALRELDTSTSTTPTSPSTSTLEATLLANLTSDGTNALNALASTSVALSTPSPDPTVLAHALIKHTATAQSFSTQLDHINSLQTYLSTQHAQLLTQLAALQTDPAFRTPQTLQRQAADQARQVKTLKSKIRDVEDRVGGLQSGGGGKTRRDRDKGRNINGEVVLTDLVTEMMETQERLERSRLRVEKLEAKVDEFAGLPPDREAARREVAKLEVELDGLRRKREGLFEGMLGK